MTSKNDLERWKLAEKKQQDLKRLERFGIRRTNENYYVHVTNVLPYGLLRNVDSERFTEVLSQADMGDVTAYQGFYGCANLCNFCPFGTMIDKNAGQTFEAMQKEHEMFARHIDPMIHALYFGGGTPSIIPNGRLEEILESIHRTFRVNKEGEWKFEVYPKRYSENQIREKLKILKNYGFTDLNIDIQSSNQDSLDAVGRSNSSFEDYMKLLDMVGDEGFDSVTSTLMAGLPHETCESFAEGLRRVVERPEITSLIVYPIFQRANRKIQDSQEYASVEVKDQMITFADDYLRENGFFPHMDKYYLREKPKTLSIEEKFSGATHIGMGTSARGCFTDSEGVQWHYHNTPFNEIYLEDIANGRFPIERMSPVSRTQQGRHYFLQALCTMESVDSAHFDSKYGTNLLKELEEPLSALSNIGVIKIDGTGVQIAEPFRSEEIIGHLRDPKINSEMLNARYANDGRNMNWGIGVPEEDKQRLLEYT